MKKEMRVINEQLSKSIAKSLRYFKRKTDAIYLFGSFLTKKFGPMSDVDVCFFGNYTFEEKLKICSFFGDRFDVCFFNELPIWIRIRVFHNSKSIFVKEKSKMYSYLFNTIREYEDFLPIIKGRMEAVLGNDR